MSRITPEMIHVFNARLSATGSPWRIVPRTYDGATYFQQTIAGSVDPTLAPFMVEDLIFDNGSDVDQQSVLKAEKTVTLEHAFALTNQVKLGTKGTVGINAGLAKVEAELSLEYTRDETTTETKTEAVTVGYEQPLLVPPHTRVTLQAIIQIQAITDLPFELRVLLADGRFAVTPKDIVPLYRYYDGTDHFYTRDARVPAGYVSEGVACHVSNVPEPGMVRLRRYYNGTEHFYTTDPNEPNPEEWSGEGDEGYVFAGGAPGAVPLYRYYDGVDHFYTTNYSELGGGTGDIVLEGIQAHVVPASIEDPALFRSVGELFPNAADRLFVVPGRYRGQSTNRRVEVRVKQEPLPLTLRMAEPVITRTPDEELQRVPVLSSDESIVARPGELLDLRIPSRPKRTKPARSQMQA